MIRAIRTELRRSNAIALVVLLIAVDALPIAAMAQNWYRQWLAFSYAQSGGLFLLVPLALAGGAMLGRREKRTRSRELIGSTGRPRWQKVTPPAVALAVAVAVVQLLTLGFGAVLIGVTGSFINVGGALPALVDITVLVGAVWLGMAAGSAWSAPLLPAGLATLALVGQLAADSAGEDSKLRNLSLNLQPPAFAWESFSTQALLGRLALGTGLLLGGLLLGFGASWFSRVAGVAALAVGLVVAAVVTPIALEDKYQVNTAAQRLVCADGTPQVCVTAIHAYDLPNVTSHVRQALALLTKLPGAPTRAEEWHADTVSGADSTQLRGPKPKPGTIMFRLEPPRRVISAASLFRVESDYPDLTASIVNGAGTTMNGCVPGDPVALGAAGAWLMGVDSLPLNDDPFPPSPGMQGAVSATVNALRELPEKEQVRRVTALRDAANECRTADLASVLTTAATS